MMMSLIFLSMSSDKDAMMVHPSKIPSMCDACRVVEARGTCGTRAASLCAARCSAAPSSWRSHTPRPWPRRQRRQTAERRAGRHAAGERVRAVATDKVRVRLLPRAKLVARRRRLEHAVPRHRSTALCRCASALCRTTAVRAHSKVQSARKANHRRLELEDVRAVSVSVSLAAQRLDGHALDKGVRRSARLEREQVDDVVAETLVFLE